MPELLAGLPTAVLVDRALMDLDSGDPLRAARARGVLLSVQEEAALDPVRLRARSSPPGSAARLEAVSVLLERGETPEGCLVRDIVGASLRDISRADGPARGALLAVDRLRGLGEAGIRELREQALSGSALSKTAARVLAALFGEARPLPETRP